MLNWRLKCNYQLVVHMAKCKKINIQKKVFDRWSSNKKKNRKIPLFWFRIFGSGQIIHGLGLHFLKCSIGESEYLTDGNTQYCGTEWFTISHGIHMQLQGTSKNSMILAEFWEHVLASVFISPCLLRSVYMMHRSPTLCQLYWLGHTKVEKKMRILSCNRDTEWGGLLRSTSLWHAETCHCLWSFFLSVGSGPLSHCVAHVLFWNVS